MNNFTIAIRSFLKKDRNNILKIISLGTGLAVGLVLISKVSFELHFDRFYPDADRIYQIGTNVIRENESPVEYGQISGAVAPGMKAELPEVEAATRFTRFINEDAVYFTPERDRYTANFLMADNHFFDVLPRPMKTGDAQEILSRPMYALVSESTAKKMGGNVIGKQIEPDKYPGKIITIGGIFEDVPENSHLQYDILVSLESIKNFTWDGRENWVGNDRYIGYVKLRPGTDPKSLAPGIRRMQEKYQDMERIKEAGVDMNYFLSPLTTLHAGSPTIQRTVLVLALLAFVLLFTAVMNYILIVISTLVGRTKEIAIYKCYGAGEKSISKLIFSETVFHLLLSLIFAILLIICFQSTVKEVLSASLGALFTGRSLLILAAVCLLICLTAGMIPSFLLSRIPVATVFRTFRSSRRGWKLALLFIQFMAASFLFTLLVIVSKQYNLMINDNPGYSYKNLIYCNTGGVNPEKRQTALNLLKQLPEVSGIASASNLPFQEFSGNNIYLPGETKELFNIADMYYADEDYFPVMEIPIVQGRGFKAGTSTGSDVLVSESFAERMKTLAGWNDGVVGKEILVSEHGLSKITGVYPDIRMGALNGLDTRPSVLFYAEQPAGTFLIRLHQLSGENIRKVHNVLKTSLPEKDILLTTYSDSMIKLYAGERLFRNAISIGGFITIIITIIGLIGYVNNEIIRRTSEIAVRKINGATLSNILNIFVKDMLRLSPTALVIGGIGAALVANKWMENFSEKAALPVWLFIACGIVILVLIELVVLINCIKIANQNPVESLKTE
jgi:Predicted ABC-type transport system involved in lysophospholipase L1 biosynthesis, permease component